MTYRQNKESDSVLPHAGHAVHILFLIDGFFSLAFIIKIEQNSTLAADISFSINWESTKKEELLLPEILKESGHLGKAPKRKIRCAFEEDVLD
jgi:hypothetical protein